MIIEASQHASASSKPLHISLDQRDAIVDEMLGRYKFERRDKGPSCHHAYRLNIDQAHTLRSAINLLPLIGEAPVLDPVCLVHGIFGSGKSFLIAVTILAFVKLIKLSAEQSRSVCLFHSMGGLICADAVVEASYLIHHQCCR